MNTAEEVFLIAAKELNFSKAAKLAYVTPQCLSNHIHRLERNYKVKLFERKPHVHLTPEGEVLQKYLIQIEHLEYQLKNELADISAGIRGKIRLGIPITRGKILISEIVDEFQSIYPNVDIEIRLDDTPLLEQRLISGQIDLFIGLEASDYPLYNRKSLINENLYLVVPKKSMLDKFKSDFAYIHQDFKTNGADIRMLSDIPFAIGNSASANNKTFHNYLVEHNLHPRVPVNVNEFDIRLDFCLKGECAVICSRFNLYYLLQLGTSAASAVYCYPLKDCNKTLDFEVITLKSAPSLEYTKKFIQIIDQTVKSYDKAIQRWLISF